MDVYRIGPFELHADRLIATRDGRPLPFGPKVALTLLALAERPGQALSKTELLDRIWPEGFVEEANLAQNVYVLRKAFRQYGVHDAIETVARHGYRLTLHAGLIEHASVPAKIGLPGLAWRAFAIGAAAATIAATLLTSASGRLGERAAVPQPLSARGARLYSIGTYFWNERTRSGVLKSLAYFAQVVDSDPADPRGYVGLADANAMIGGYCYGTQGPSIYFARARAYADEALALDPESAEAHAALGLVALQRSDDGGAMRELEQSLALDPAYAPAQEWYGITLVEDGRLNDGTAHLQTAAALDPLSVATTAWLGAAAYRAHRFDVSIAYGRHALELSPTRVDVLATLGKAYEARGDVDAAIAAFKRYAAVDPFYRAEAAALLSRAYALEHRMPEARADFSYALAHAERTFPTDLAAAAAALGDRKTAVEILRRVHGHVFRLA